MDQRKLELYKRGMASRLYGSHLDDERSTYLSDYKNVLSDLPAATCPPRTARTGILLSRPSCISPMQTAS